MARFYGSLKGQAKTEATRRGHVNSGITGHIRGWNSGVQVVGEDENGKDIFNIFMTGGSNGGHREFLGVVRYEDGEPKFYSNIHTGPTANARAVADF